MFSRACKKFFLLNPVPLHFPKRSMKNANYENKVEINRFFYERQNNYSRLIDFGNILKSKAFHILFRYKINE